ncbi:MAG TPA: HEAT repeat domain-containing protein, partial [Pyrinomonadaceae bacterium]|nr:HEAT repeat domain-containing protein [Pyrinomonadaceae bacterium]
KRIEQPKYPRLSEAFPQFRPATSTLVSTLSNQQESQDVKREAAFALGTIGDESATPALRQNANDADYYLAEISRESLRKIAVAVNTQKISTK